MLGSSGSEMSEFHMFPASTRYLVWNEFCERFSYYGMKTILALFLFEGQRLTEVQSTEIVHFFMVLCNAIPVLGAIISDSVLVLADIVCVWSSLGAQMACWNSRECLRKAQCVGMILFTLLGFQRCGAYEFKVGGLDAWALPTDVKPDIYKWWSANNEFKVGDSLLFLYPPSQDSVVQVTAEAYNKCNISNPIGSFDDGNTVFKLVRPGSFYFTSGVPGHCEKSQKLAVVVMSANGAHGSASAPAFGLLTGEGAPALPPNGVPSTGGAPAVRSVTSQGLMAVLAFGLFMPLH